MLMSLAQGKLVVCLEVRISLSYFFNRLLLQPNRLPGWLQPQFNLKICFSRDTDSHW